MDGDWVAFGLTDEQAEQYAVLVDGVPRRLREPLIAWLKHLLSGDTYERLMNARTRHLELLSDVPVGVREDVYAQWGEYTKLLRDLDETSLLKVIDAALASEWYGTQLTALESVLALGRSKWTVGTRMGRPGLQARQPEGVQDMVEATISSSGTAGQILARAWGKVHAFTPDDPGAYADAVRAVEAAAKPLIEPSNAEATLGSMAAVMRSQGDWLLPLREHSHAPTNEMLVAMMRSLYRGHVDRHGNDDYRDVTHIESLAGVALAATLVSWFASGAVERRPGTA